MKKGVRPFHKIGRYLARWYMGTKEEQKRRMKLRELLSSLFPMDRMDRLLMNYYGERIGVLVMCLFVETGISILFLLFGDEKNQIVLGKSKDTILDMKTILLFGALVGVLLFVQKRSALEKELKNREKQMRRDYPKIVTELTLLFLAGMTIREAWAKVVTAYSCHRQKGKPMRYAYEEMLLTYRELEGGMSEGEAYNRFGRRCKLVGYVKLSGLLVQNLQKGNESLSQLLAYEGIQAMEERKNLAKKQGEEAATKLLLPMLLMLAIVIIILMVPAFLTLQM